MDVVVLSGSSSEELVVAGLICTKASEPVFRVLYRDTAVYCMYWN